MKKELIDNRKQKLDRLETWSERISIAVEITLLVQQEAERTQWEIDVLENMPAEASEIPLEELENGYERELSQLTSSLPMMPEYDRDRFLNSSGTATANTASLYEFVSRVGDIETSEAIDYSQQFTAEYQALQKRQNRTASVRNLIKKLESKNTLDRFDRANETISNYKLGVSSRTSAANEARNLLYGIKGDLFQFARSWEDENMTWEEMAKRLGASEFDQKKLVREKSNHSTLVNRLSAISKDRERGFYTNLNYIWTQSLDHLYVALTAIDLKEAGPKK